jgi:hypothetical protein
MNCKSDAANVRQTLFNYENHYSARLNKCFFLEIAVSNEKGNPTSSKIMRLFDVGDNKEYEAFAHRAASSPTTTNGAPVR